MTNQALVEMIQMAYLNHTIPIVIASYLSSGRAANSKVVPGM